MFEAIAREWAVNAGEGLTVVVALPRAIATERSGVHRVINGIDRHPEYAEVRQPDFSVLPVLAMILRLVQAPTPEFHNGRLVKRAERRTKLTALPFHKKSQSPGRVFLAARAPLNRLVFST
jgi:hypothetical protein